MFIPADKQRSRISIAENMTKKQKTASVRVLIETSGNGESQTYTQPKTIFNVNKEMLPYKLHFFLFLGGLAAVFPYMSDLGESLGMTATALGFLYTVHEFSNLLTKPIIAYFADYFNKLKTIISTLTIIQVSCYFLLLAVPKIDPRNQTSLNNDSYLEISRDTFRLCSLCSRSDDPRWTCTEKVSSEVFSHLQSSFEYTDIYCAQTSVRSLRFRRKSVFIKYIACNLDVLNATLSQESMRAELKNFIYTTILLHNTTNSEDVVLCTDSTLSNKLPKSNSTAENLLTTCLTPEKNDDSLLPVANNNVLHLFNVHCKGDKADSNLTNHDDTEDFTLRVFKTYQYWMFGICFLMATACTGSLLTLWDTACHESIQTTGSEYGKEALWAAVSSSAFAPLGGFLNDITNGYLAAWCLMGVIMAVDLLNLSQMNLVKPHFSQNILKDIGKVLSSREFLAFEMGIFMNGFCTGMIWFYLTWFLVDMRASHLLIGLANTVQYIVGDVPLMFYSAWLIKKLGYFNIVTLALLAHSLRFICYSYIHNAWFVLPVEVLHGFTHGLFYSAMTSYGKENSEPGTETTTQSLLCSAYAGLGSGFSCLLGGYSIDRIGCRMTFFYFGIFAACAAIINIVSTLILRVRKGILQVKETSNGLNVFSIENVVSKMLNR